MSCNESPLQVPYFAFFSFWMLKVATGQLTQRGLNGYGKKSWDRRHFKAVVEHVLSVPWGWNFSKTKVRVVDFTRLAWQEPIL